jgi:hypothetical protein
MSDSIPFNETHIAALSQRIFVILLKDEKGRLTLLADPGMNQPWSSKNKRLADFHAKQCDGEARTWAEAFALLAKDNPGFEKELIERVRKRAQDFTKTALDHKSKVKGFNVNPNSSPSDGTLFDGSGNTVRPSDN